jgi:hypothetical protein
MLPVASNEVCADQILLPMSFHLGCADAHQILRLRVRSKVAAVAFTLFTVWPDQDPGRSEVVATFLELRWYREHAFCESNQFFFKSKTYCTSTDRSISVHTVMCVVHAGMRHTSDDFKSVWSAMEFRMLFAATVVFGLFETSHSFVL